MVDAVIVHALELGEITATETREAARSVVAQLEGHVVFAKLYKNTSQLSRLRPTAWRCSAPHSPEDAMAGH